MTFFKPEDFDPGIGPADDGQELCTYQWAARKANEKLRERGRVVECYELKESGITDEHGPGWTAAELSTRITQPESTHRGLLLIGEPISKDTAESLLREWLSIADGTVNPRAWEQHKSVRQRAEKLLGTTHTSKMKGE